MICRMILAVVRRHRPMKYANKKKTETVLLATTNVSCINGAGVSKTVWRHFFFSSSLSLSCLLDAIALSVCIIILAALLNFFFLFCQEWLIRHVKPHFVHMINFACPSLVRFSGIVTRASERVSLLPRPYKMHYVRHSSTVDYCILFFSIFVCYLHLVCFCKCSLIPSD